MIYLDSAVKASVSDRWSRDDKERKLIVEYTRYMPCMGRRITNFWHGEGKKGCFFGKGKGLESTYLMHLGNGRAIRGG